MTDFLTRLIDRALNRGPRLNRRTPSLFEPSGMTPSLQEETVVAEAVDRPRAVDTGSREVSHVRPDPDPGPERPHVVTTDETLLDNSAPAATPPAPPADSTITLAPAVVAPSVTRIETQIRHHETLVQRTESHTIERHETVREPEVIEKTVIVESAVPAKVAVAPALRPDATLVTSPPATRMIHEAIAVPPTPPERSVIPPEAKAPGKAPQIHTEGVVQPRSSSVTVTIGRVEIHSVPPAKPAPREKRSAAPRMNLDEYLRRRGGGAS